MTTFCDLNRCNDEFGSAGCNGLNREFNELFENRGGSRDWMDPIDLLPVDPFGMELGNNLAAAIAGWIEDLNSHSNYLCFENIVQIEGFYDCELSYCNTSHGKASSSYESFDITNIDVEYVNGKEENKESVPHEGLMLSLAYLDIEDLLSVDMVCKSLHFAVQNEWWLWRCIHIDSPLSEKINDDALRSLCLKAQGRLQCLSLNGCSRITDDGLRNVLELNPMLEKLNVSGCLRLSMDGLINSLKAFKAINIIGIQTLKLGRLFRVSSENYEALQLLVGSNDKRIEKLYTPRFYHMGASSIACDNDGRALDIELCTGCQKYKLVFDCPSEVCQGKNIKDCRACDKCIERCVMCGRCIKDRKFVETFFMDYLCSDCWKQTPTCHEECDN